MAQTAQTILHRTVEKATAMLYPYMTLTWYKTTGQGESFTSFTHLDIWTYLDCMKQQLEAIRLSKRSRMLATST